MAGSKVTNTTAEVQRSPIIGIVQSLPGGIEAQELRGQRELVESTQIPARFDGFTEADLKTLGFTLGPVDPRDPLFRPATFPSGWSRRASDHSMWSAIVDDQGRDRFEVFYKAAYYDRDARISIVTRFRVAAEYPIKSPGIYRVLIKDGGREVFAIGSLPYDRKDEGETFHARMRAQDALIEEGKAWLQAHYPDHKNPLAYWDLPPILPPTEAR